MMRQAALLFLSLFSVNSFANGYVIGNGGDAIYIDGRLYARDLVENGVESNPYFGELFDPSLTQIINHLDNKHKNLVYSRELLHRKLSDLNAIHPNLGHYIAMALSNYKWRLVNIPLATTASKGEIFLGLRKSLVQIANRLDRDIRIHKQSWERLSSDQRIVILIHEAVFSLLKPTCGDQYCFQSDRVARTITATFFDGENFVNTNPQAIASLYLSLLNIPTGYHEDLQYQPKWILQLIDSTFRETEINSYSPQNLALFSPKGPEQLKGIINYYCKKNLFNGERKIKLISTLIRPSFEARFSFYKTESIIEDQKFHGRQLNLSITQRSPQEQIDVIEHEYLKSNENKCGESIFLHYQMLLKDF